MTRSRRSWGWHYTIKIIITTCRTKDYVNPQSKPIMQNPDNLLNWVGSITKKRTTGDKGKEI